MSLKILSSLSIRRAEKRGTKSSEKEQDPVAIKLDVADVNPTVVQGLIAESVASAVQKRKEPSIIQAAVADNQFQLVLPPLGPQVGVHFRQVSGPEVSNDLLSAIERGVQDGYDRAASQLAARTQLPKQKVDVRFVSQATASEALIGTSSVANNNASVAGHVAQQQQQEQGPAPSNTPTPKPGW